jgi:prepilin-type N-terminal cleavage/methylation domain-containing protein
MTHQQGFTLLETMIAITLMAFLALGLTAALKLGLAFPGAAQSLDHSGPVIAVQNFLRRELSSALALPAADWDGVAFLGSASAFEMIGAMPERAAAGGLHEVRLSLDGDKLMLRWRRLDPPGPAQERALLDHVRGIDIAYWGSRHDTEAAAWHPDWRAAQYLPALVRVRAMLDGADWPELLVALPVQPEELRP